MCKGIVSVNSFVWMLSPLKVREERKGKGADCCFEGVADDVGELGNFGSSVVLPRLNRQREQGGYCNGGEDGDEGSGMLSGHRMSFKQGECLVQCVWKEQTEGEVKERVHNHLPDEFIGRWLKGDYEDMRVGCRSGDDG